MSKPAQATCHPATAACYRVTMTLNNFSLMAAGPPPDPDTNLVWLTQWLVPASPTCTSTSSACVNGGKNFIVYAESTAGGALKCFYGENAAQLLGGGAAFTYPGNVQITAAGACSATTGPAGTITIEVPVANVSLPPAVPPLDSRLYSITASTMTSTSPFNSVPSLGGIGGVFFNLIDAARAYDGVFGATAVAVRSFTAARSGRRTVVLRWRTGSEVGLAGFHVFRAGDTGRVRVTRSLIPAAGDSRGHAYVWRGRVPAGSGKARYWLQWVRVDGTRAWFGPQKINR
jgi:hypothetical protein